MTVLNGLQRALRRGVLRLSGMESRARRAREVFLEKTMSEMNCEG